MLSLLRIELVKIRRSLALGMLFAIPAIVVVFNALVLTRRVGLDHLTPDQVRSFWMMNVTLWAFFMQPLFIALVTGLLNGQEHRNQTWRMMFTLPLSPVWLYLAKWLVAFGFVACASALLLALAGGVLALLAALGAPVEQVWHPQLAQLWFKLALGCLPVVALQHALAWRVPNLVAPLALGVVATMMVTQTASSQYWVWLPWDYALMAVAGSMPGAADFALWLAATTGAAFTVLGAAAFARALRA